MCKALQAVRAIRYLVPKAQPHNYCCRCNINLHNEKRAGLVYPLNVHLNTGAQI